MKNFSKRFYNSKAWSRCRDAYLRQRIMIDGGMCEECHNELGYIVHHRIMLTEQNINDPDITLNHDNLEYVCKHCHDRFEGHGVRGTRETKQRAIFDSTGQVIGVYADEPAEIV